MSSLKNILLASTMLLSFGAFASNEKEDLSDAPKQGIQYCSAKPEIVEHFAPGIDADRASLIAMFRKKWVNGTRLTYYFFDKESDGEFALRNGNRVWVPWKAQHSGDLDVVRKAFKQWKDLGIGLSFVEVDDRRDADIRIGFMQGDGAWSYLGRDILGRSKNARTMNFGWMDEDTALHEIGHTIGFPHEHQNPLAGIKWDEDKVYEDLAGSPNFWPREKTFHNIIRKINPDDVQGTNWDPNSIMHYPFDAGMILEPVDYQTQPLIPTPGLSSRDKDWIQRFYPPIVEDGNVLNLGESNVDLQNGENRIFKIKPSDSSEYRIETLGVLDTIMVLSDSAGRRVAADDDSGTDFNARIQAVLLAGAEYSLSLRLYYRGDSGSFKLNMSKL